MSIDDRLRALAAKGELCHVSLIFTDNTFRATFAPASRSGYVLECDPDPVKAIEKAFDAAKIRGSHGPSSVGSTRSSASDVTGAVTKEISRGHQVASSAKASPLPSDWTKP